MEETIGDKINQAQFKFIQEINRAPSKVYLGKTEMNEFLDWITNFMELEERPKVSQGLNFLGLKMFEVNIESHLNVTL